jgi:hypothetical protein
MTTFRVVIRARSRADYEALLPSGARFRILSEALTAFAQAPAQPRPVRVVNLAPARLELQHADRLAEQMGHRICNSSIAPGRTRSLPRKPIARPMTASPITSPAWPANSVICEGSGPIGPVSPNQKPPIRARPWRTSTSSLDLLAGRMLQFFYRAWADSQPAAQADRPADDRFADVIASSIAPALRRDANSAA